MKLRRTSRRFVSALLVGAALFALESPLLAQEEDLTNIWGDTRPARSYGGYSTAESGQTQPVPQPSVPVGARSSLYPSIPIPGASTAPVAEQLPHEAPVPPTPPQYGSRYDSNPVHSPPATWGIPDQPDGTIGGRASAPSPQSRPAPQGLVVAGRAQAGNDGQTLVLDGRIIRLDNIHAPEAQALCATDYRFSWPCGQKSRDKLAELVAELDLRCEGRAWSGEALVASCYRQDGLDIGASLVRNGLAVVNRAFFDAYQAEEEHARRNRLGLWSGTFDTPWES